MKKNIVVTNIRDVNKYDTVIPEANKTSKERNKVKNSRGKKVVPRKYHLSNENLEKLKKQQEETGKFPNPYKRNGVYSSLIQALINLGVNKSHRFIDVKNEMKNIMSQQTNKEGNTLWHEFYYKKSNNKSSCGQWDVNSRIEHTAKILQRLGGLHPYGYKLKQLCACVDLMPSSDPLLKNKPNIRLNASFPSPHLVQPVKPAKGKKRKN